MLLSNVRYAFLLLYIVKVFRSCTLLTIAVGFVVAEMFVYNTLKLKGRTKAI